MSTHRSQLPMIAGLALFLMGLCQTSTVLASRTSAGSTPTDFDGDGYPDLAVGAPFEDIGSSAEDAGMVEILYGSPTGVVGQSAFLFAGDESQDTVAFADCGTTVMTGDFDGDGFSDVVIDCTSKEINGELIYWAGLVNVVYGSPVGPDITTRQIFSLETAGMPGSSVEMSLFGLSLAAGDFNGDGRDDLALGVPGGTVGAVPYAGYVNVLYGSSTGLSVTGVQSWSQNSSGIADTAEEGDVFGWTLAAGDVNSDGEDDLAIGVPSESVGSTEEAGAIHILYGSVSGLSSTNSQFIYQDGAVVPSLPATSDAFGEGLTIGDFNGDHHADLAVGAKGEDVARIVDAGAVFVLYGSSTGIKTSGNQLWHRHIQGVAGSQVKDDHCGYVMTAGDFNEDGRDELAFACWGGSGYVDGEGYVGTALGSVSVLYGSATGLTATGSQVWSHANIPQDPLSAAQNINHFGSALTTADYNLDGKDDLLVGDSQDEVNGVGFAGSIALFFGSSTGITQNGVASIHQNSAGVSSTAEKWDYFGYSVCSH